MKPTVSVRMKGWQPGAAQSRAAGSSVANSSSATRKSAPVSRFSKVVLPAFV